MNLSCRIDFRIYRVVWINQQEPEAIATVPRLRAILLFSKIPSQKLKEYERKLNCFISISSQFEDGLKRMNENPF